MGFIDQISSFLNDITNGKITSENHSFGKLVKIEEPKLFILLIEAEKEMSDDIINNTIRKIIIHEDEWRNHWEIIKSRIVSLLGQSKRIHGRDTRVKPISKDEAIDFQKEHHLNVALNSKYRLGLFHKEELVAVAIFGKVLIKSNEQNQRSGELIRFCNKRNTTVVGGLSKLINHFVIQQELDDVMTYVDKDWSDGKSYMKLGFQVMEETPPQEFMVNKETMERLPFNHTEFNVDTHYKVTNSGNLKLIKSIE